MSFLDGLRLEPKVASSLIDLSMQEGIPRKKDRFIRGPIPCEWIGKAACLPGKALHIALMVRYLDGFERSGSVRIKPSVRDAYGLDRFATARALRSLEEAGLLSVARKRGAAPTVTIFESQVKEADSRPQ